jgi:hypothetical protein
MRRGGYDSIAPKGRVAAFPSEWPLEDPVRVGSSLRRRHLSIERIWRFGGYPLPAEHRPHLQVGVPRNPPILPRRAGARSFELNCLDRSTFGGPWRVTCLEYLSRATT